MRRYRPHIFVMIALAIVLTGGWHSSLRNVLADLRFAWQSRQVSGDIVVIAIDASSIERIGVWPWPRLLHAELIRQLQKADVQDIALDVDFSTPSDASSDRNFAEALEGAGGSVVLPSFQQPRTDRTTLHVNRPLQQFAEHSWSAIVNVEVGPDGLVRRYPFGEKLDGKFVPSMAAVLAGQYAEKRTPFLIDFSIRTAGIPKVSFADVLSGDPATLQKLRGKKVVIGGTALELGDRFSVPNGVILSGPVLQTLAAESLLQNRALQWTSGVVTAAGLALLALLMLFSWRRLSAGKRVALLGATAGTLEAGAFALQAAFPLILDTSLFHIAIIVYVAAIALDEIDIRDLLGRVAESRFQRVAMSLGDGLICTDSNYLITVWNPGATAIFGYLPEEIIGRPFDEICARDEALATSGFSIKNAAHLAAGSVVEFDGRRRNGEVFPVEASFSGWQGTDGFQFGAILRDISVRKREAERVRYLAEHDTLTGLINRNTLHAQLETKISAAETDGRKVALLVIGIDGFQQINDMLGNTCGDLVLRAISQRLMAAIPPAGLVARLSGDEFAIAVPTSDIGENLSRFAEQIGDGFDAPLLAGNRHLRVKVSIGAAVCPGDGRTADELLSNAHLALSRAKAINRGGYVLFEDSIRRELEKRLTLEAELALAAERNEFELFYQPQFHLADGQLIGAEALIRWRHPERGLVSPGEFMPVVNTSPISERIAEWVLQAACTHGAAWERAGHKLRIGVNLSPSQLESGDLAVSVAQVLASTGFSPTSLELEVTEDILLHDEQAALNTFLEIQELGIRLSFDDFGTGFASLSYLKKFPLDGLKIDRSFVLGLLTNPDDAAIVSSTIGLSKQLGLSVIAEGIEDRATADLLVRMGCEEGQGYCFGKPMPARDFEARFLTAPATAEVA
ncbi:EAL domain-containing protein [Bradyrhizobium sp. sBnM-33]|uniref:EAL domain-containing protein n=1 Tax=Bradyrhizobium sp. sBnM-33 TaxID=2831780 RepID=UPI001BCEDC0C|nr:EAL domain-containing protein [Bradyrhizobium sp. sBnM-33]WOH54098.1 EAL domain-containing protein [Bradyrhizobium sp. sBnM-33]